MFAARIAKAPIKPSHCRSKTRARQHSTLFARSAADGALGNHAGAPRSTPGLTWDFGGFRLVPLDQSVSPPAGDKHMRSLVLHHRHAFSAAIRRVSPAGQCDAMSAEQPESAIDQAPITQAATAVPARAFPEPKEGETVRFPDTPPLSIAMPPQLDPIASTFGYTSSIAQGPAPASPDGFGKTTPFYEITDRTATYKAGTYHVTGTVNAKITFWVAGGNRTNIASEAAPVITQANYPKVVSDLTPAPAAVNKGGLSLMKNQPPRTQFWAEDLTIEHECFHADEDVKFGQEGTTLGQNWLNKQTARDYDQVGDLFPRVLQIIVQTVDTRMALPAREERAYDDGAPAYRARAQAIKRKGDAKGYPATPQTPPAAASKKPELREFRWVFR